MADDYIVRPVYKALQVLRCLEDERRDLTLSEIAARMALPKTTVFRYLQTLRACDFVLHDAATDLYRSARAVQPTQPGDWVVQRLRELALPQMRLLRDQFQETVNLGWLSGHEVVYLEIVESRRSTRHRAGRGTHDPLYSTALGKAMLAALPEMCIGEHLPAQISPRTPETLTSPGALHGQLRLVRQHGYAVDRGENESSACCVGAAIIGPQERVVAALSLTAPPERFTPRLQRTVGRGVVAAAQQISAQLQLTRAS